jgi:hypothetical protein
MCIVRTLCENVSEFRKRMERDQASKDRGEGNFSAVLIIVIVDLLSTAGAKESLTCFRASNLKV